MSANATPDTWLDIGTLALPQVSAAVTHGIADTTAALTVLPGVMGAIDVDALAAAVLALMKHELRIERERLA